MRKKKKFKVFFSTIASIFVFFILAAFVTTCCIMLFISALQNSVGREFTQDEITLAAKITMVNVVLISVIMAAIDYIRRKIMVERPTKTITEATEKIMSGDFSVRIDPMQSSGMEGFNQIAEAINKMAEELAGVETLRADFIANVSHEIKTPLSVMQNYGTLLQSSELSEEKRLEYAKGINDASRRLSEMITNILKLNRLENQQIFPEISEFYLGEQLCECLLQFENVWETKNIEIKTDIDEDVKVEADAELLSIVWNNLFSNAFKFTDDGGTVSLSLKADDDYAVICIKDTGCGMTAEVGKHIFEKFYQGDVSHSAQGNGLGLPLVKRVIDILHGEITVKSVVGEGTAFSVKIRRV